MNKEQLIEKFEGRIKDIIADNRSIESGNGIATVFSNAPLALIQVQMSTEIQTLKAVIYDLKQP